MHSSVWNQSLPDLQTLIGSNLFRILAEDVTPAPFNQPPYPASGDSAKDSCRIVVNGP